MPKIKFENTGQTFDVAEGASVLECAVANHIPLEHDCGGNCACTTCEVRVVDGMQNLSSLSEEERGLLEANDKWAPDVRLGCQCRVKTGAVVVRYPD
jgi:2Fe-2S ferredoxin